MHPNGTKGNNVDNNTTKKPELKPTLDIWFRIDRQLYEELGVVLVNSGRKSMSNVVGYACKQLIENSKKQHPEWWNDEKV